MKKYFIYSLVVITATLTSCDKILETQPKESVDLEGATKSIDAMKATITSIYNALQASGYYGRDFIAAVEVLADNGQITTSNSNRFVSQANNTPGSHVGIFTIGYTNIFRANFVLKYVDGTTTGTAAEKDKLKGTAYFMRALLYFDLVRSYARNPAYFANGFDLGVPIVTDAIIDASKTEYPSRAKVVDVYAQIVDDLKAAIPLLNNADGSKRVNKTAAQALLSRAYLYAGNYEEAEKSATDALTSMAGLASFAADSATYVTKWGNGYPEMIFGLNYEPGESLGTDCIQGIFYRIPPSVGYGDITSRAELLNDFYPNDRRRKNLIIATKKNVADPNSQDVNYTLKYPNGKGTFGTDDIQLLRVSELYLNRAEARALKGSPDEAGALDDLNRIHQRAGLPALGALTGEDLVEAIWKERRLELAFEGHRLFDILRTGKNLVKGTTTINYDDYKLIAPIPATELDANPKLRPNNPGY